MCKFCITIKFKPLQWFEHPKPLICITWILSPSVTLVQCFLICHNDFDPSSLSFHHFCSQEIHS
uniref:Ovule protein n=1 Tax=Romanomermis culicivorax TaxID=13658 RepID=A0A915JS66_ROMCU